MDWKFTDSNSTYGVWDLRVMRFMYHGLNLRIGSVEGEARSLAVL